jgi:hypothetical protein
MPYEGPERRGVMPLYLDLKTGTFTRRMLKPVADGVMATIYATYDHSKLFGKLWRKEKVTYFLMDSQSGAWTPLPKLDLSHHSFFLDEAERRLYLAGLKSAGWWVVDLDGGQVLSHHPGPPGGFISHILPVAGGRVALIQANASLTRPLSTVTIFNPQSGALVGGARVRDNYTGAATVSRDRKKLYWINSHSISRLDL